MMIKAINEINEGSLTNIQAIHLCFPVTSENAMIETAGTAIITAKIDNFSIFYFLFLVIDPPAPHGLQKYPTQLPWSLTFKLRLPQLGQHPPRID